MEGWVGFFGEEEACFVFYKEQVERLDVMGCAAQLKAQWERKKSLPFKKARGQINARTPLISRS